MKKNIYLIRHGQTDFNLKGIIQGSRVDTDLNDTGRAQAAKFFEMYKDVPFDKIYTSKLKRTVQSVQKFIDLGIAYEAYEGLNEISWGNQDGVATNSAMNEHYHSVSKEWVSGNLELKIGGGESPIDVAKRQKPVIDLILSRNDEKNVLVCMHGRAIRILLCNVLGESLTRMDSFEHANLCLYLLEFDGQYTRIVKANDWIHLK